MKGRCLVAKLDEGSREIQRRLKTPFLLSVPFYVCSVFCSVFGCSVVVLYIFGISVRAYEVANNLKYSPTRLFTTIRYPYTLSTTWFDMPFQFYIPTYALNKIIFIGITFAVLGLFCLFVFFTKRAKYEQQKINEFKEKQA